MKKVYGGRRTIKRHENYQEILGDSHGIRYIQRQGEKDCYFDCTGQEVDKDGNPVFIESPEPSRVKQPVNKPHDEKENAVQANKNPTEIPPGPSTSDVDENICAKCGYKARSQLDLRIHSRTCK